MSMEYIRKTYGVPAKRGGIIKYTGSKNEVVLMEIIGTKGHYLRCKMCKGVNSGLKTLLHPAWEIEYL